MVQIVFHEDRCKGCELCQITCPKNLVVTSNRLNPLGFYPAVISDRSQCTGCALCARMCPDLCIEIGQEGA
ncbi:MAG: 4Fe-4S binding protein [Firmicutes bacterium]|nr:4Fe-4S binding protein [Bacillota bacterium]